MLYIFLSHLDIDINIGNDRSLEMCRSNPYVFLTLSIYLDIEENLKDNL